MPYEFFDKIICINLKIRQDRYESVKKEFNELNINNVEYFFADKSSKGGRYGCFESHISVIQKCYNEGCNNILIFEDDIRPSSFYNIDLLNIAINFMKSNNEWDIFYLGYFIINNNYISDNMFLSYNLLNQNIIQYNPCATHAYCLNRNTMKKILSTYQKYINDLHIDIYYAKHEIFTNYCIIPMLFEQYYCYSSNIETYNIEEEIVRKMSCFAGDYININSNSTFLLYLYNKFYYVFCIILILLLYLLINNFFR
jgi:GR25 family glycosyltransferase involved in LPS biosynthesis